MKRERKNRQDEILTELKKNDHKSAKIKNDINDRILFCNMHSASHWT
jgi:hypothetical protein